MTENNIYEDKKIDTKKAGFIRPARYFSNIQLSNSRHTLAKCGEKLYYSECKWLKVGTNCIKVGESG